MVLASDLLDLHMNLSRGRMKNLWEGTQYWLLRIWNVEEVRIGSYHSDHSEFDLCRVNSLRKSLWIPSVEWLRTG